MGANDRNIFLHQLRRCENRIWNRLLKRSVKLKGMIRLLGWDSGYTTHLAHTLHADGLVLLSSPMDGDIKIKLTQAGVDALASR